MTPTITKPPFTPPTTTTPAAQKNNFVQNAGKPQVLKAPPKKKSFTLEDEESQCVKTLLFGFPGTGKTLAAGHLILGGYKVAMLATDMGGSGHESIRSLLKKEGRKDLFKNLLIIPVKGYKETNSFLEQPFKFCPELESFSPDFLMWDGFGSWQQVDVSEYVGDMAPAKDKDRGDFRESGLVLEVQDWGAIKNATIRKVNDFLDINGPDKNYHKILTCHEATEYKTTAGKSELVSAYKPLLSGAGAQLVIGAVDLVLRCKVVTKRGAGADNDDRVYTYVTRGHENTVAKCRGFELAPEEPADFLKLWKKISQNFETGINQPASD